MIDVKKYDAILSRGLCKGIGKQGSQVCIEAAICEALGLPHDDDPKCVSKAVRKYKIAINDANWSSPEARAKGLRDIGLAQLGSLGVVDDVAFSARLIELTIREMLPSLLREVFPNNETIQSAALRCEQEGTYAAACAAACAADATAYAARAAAYAADVAAYAAAYAADVAARAAAYAADAADAAAYAADAADGDKYLLLSVSLAMRVLRELGSPGCELLEAK
jgi:hypothetical protein